MVGQAAGQDQRGKGLLMNREVEILANLEEIKDFIPYLTYRTILGKILEGKDPEGTARGIRKLRKKMMKADSIRRKPHLPQYTVPRL